eukprot:4501319-Alexandrium_andersonii.AAC.1
MSASLVGSEMCIRDRSMKLLLSLPKLAWPPCRGGHLCQPSCGSLGAVKRCLLYTSDAADDM